MNYDELYEQAYEWQRKGATLSDKPARQEFGLTQDEIYDAIDAGALHCRQAAMHGNPWLRLLRREVEALARTRHGDRYVNEQQARAELARVNREIRRLRTELTALEERRSKLSTDLGECTAAPRAVTGRPADLRGPQGTTRSSFQR
jgi:septal ring factor EnvC (AmiA/AmiB activator)